MFQSIRYDVRILTHILWNLSIYSKAAYIFLVLYVYLSVSFPRGNDMMSCINIGYLSLCREITHLRQLWVWSHPPFWTSEKSCLATIRSSSLQNQLQVPRLSHTVSALIGYPGLSDNALHSSLLDTVVLRPSYQTRGWGTLARSDTLRPFLELHSHNCEWALLKA